MFRIHGVAVIVGAATGIGRATVKAFVEAGCTKLALLDINSDGLEVSKAQAIEIAPNAEVKTYHCDTASPENIGLTYDQLKADFGRVDYAVHCAAITTYGATIDLPLAEFDRLFNINLRGTFLCSKAVLKIMRSQSLDCEAYPDAKIPAYRAQRGAIVNISSGLGWTSIPALPAYCSAKAAVMSLTRSDGIDYAPDRIRVNSVAPGICDTQMTSQPEVRAALEGYPIQVHTPLRRFGQPEEVADVIVFLASNRASFVTGSVWSVDGGYSST